MIEGTRSKIMDERLGLHDTKLEEINQGLSKTGYEFAQKIERIEGSIAELKQMLMGLQISKRNEGLVVIQIDEDGSEGILDNSATKQDVNKIPFSGNYPNSFSSTPILHVLPHIQQAQMMHNFTAYIILL